MIGSDPRLAALLQHLQDTGFHDVAGARASVTVPISEALLNAVLAGSIPPSAPVREVYVRPEASNRLAVRVRLAKPAFLPPINLGLVIERQPEFPASPVLVLRLTSLPGLMSLAGAAMSFVNVLPPGVRMVGERIVVDIAAQLERAGQLPLMAHLRRLDVLTEPGRLILDVRVEIAEGHAPPTPHDIHPPAR
jgi:hypothetical protein